MPRKIAVPSKSIGVFDSGVGGLSIARAIRQSLPFESITYVADQAHAPYGDKTTDFLLVRTKLITRFLVEHDCKAIVIACNTATVNTINQLRSLFNIPVIGVEPGIKPAINLSKTRSVGVLATQQTINSPSFKQFVNQLRDKAEIELQACPQLVDLVERGELTSSQTYKAVSEYVEPLLEKGVDQIVLGCTHYPLLKSVINDVVDGRAEIVETSLPVAKQVKKRLIENDLLLDAGTPDDQFWSSGCNQQAALSISRLWHKVVEVKQLEL